MYVGVDDWYTVIASMADTSLKIFFHDRCFDGVTSAALFSDFFRFFRGPDVDIQYFGMVHSSVDPFASVTIDGDDNACVDFRYSPDPNMNWWFDHHQSAFQSPALRDHFDAYQAAQKVHKNTPKTKFFDPAARSCALYMRRTLESEYGYAPEDPDGHWQELLEWADRIDGAVFSSAREIVELNSPALQLMTWLRSNTDINLTVRLMGEVGRSSLAALIRKPWIAEPLRHVLQEHRDSIELVKQRTVMQNDVVTYDLSNDSTAVHSGFIAYMLHPEARYSVSLAVSGDAAIIAVGSNPWASKSRAHNIAAICETYGGGGHPHVGGISVPSDDLSRARDIVGEVVAVLSQSPSKPK